MKRSVLILLTMFTVGCSDTTRPYEGIEADGDGDGDGDADGDGDGDGDGDADGDADMDWGEWIEPVGEIDAEQVGYFLLIESGSSQFFDLALVGFDRSRSLEIQRRCDPRHVPPLEDCAIFTRADELPWTCEEECNICGPTEDCTARQCYEFDETLRMEAGDVRIAGGAGPVTCPEEPGSFHYECNNRSHTTFEPGDEVHITAPGGSFPAFELTIPVHPRPELLTDTSAWQISDFDGSADIRVTWEPAGPSSYIGIQISIVNGNASLFCQARDDGAFDIPAELIAELDGSAASRLNFRLSRHSEAVVYPTDQSAFRAEVSSEVLTHVSEP